MRGRVPPEAVALVLEAPAGTELTCRAHNHTFEQCQPPTERGIISYYAGQALSGAVTAQSWLDSIRKSADSDRAAGLLPAFRWPSLTLLGDPSRRLPGKPI